MDLHMSVRLYRLQRHERLLAYGAAATIGLWFTAWIFSTALLFNGAVPDTLLYGDVGKDVLGQRAYFVDGWHWPLLRTTMLEWPAGVSIAMSDSIPLIALPLKLISFLLPKDFSAMFMWLAFAYFMQPIAAVFALRSAGERRLLPALAISAFSIAMPTFLFRHGHIAISSHFLLLLAVGGYFRMVRALPGARTLPVCLVPASLLVHPYMALMVFAILLAAPLTLAIRRDRRCVAAGSSLMLGLSIATVLYVVLGYQGIAPTSGFGFASMNALSPGFPTFSSLVAPGLPMIDATGGQYEGYQYLGLGLILLLLVCLVAACLSTRTAFLQRHWGLALCCIAMTLLALSNRIYVGSHKILDLGEVPMFMHQIRASGRLFWVVAYLLLVGSVVAIGRLLPRPVSAGILVALAAVQFADMRGMRAGVRGAMHGGATLPLVLDPVRVETLMAHHHRLVLYPTFGCGADWHDREFSQLVLAAPRNHVAVNTEYLARLPTIPDCDPSVDALSSLSPGELRVFLPQAAQAGPFSMPGGPGLCRQFGRAAVCTLQTELVAMLPPVTPPAAVLDKDYTLTSMPLNHMLGTGWSQSDPVGTWTDARSAVLVAQLPDLHGADLAVSVFGHGFTGRHDVPQHVDVSANGHKVAAWDVSSDADVLLSATIPSADLDERPLVLRFDIAKPTRPCDVPGWNSDFRDLGMFVQKVRFGTKPGPANHS
jgi:hypothetical protein